MPFDLPPTNGAARDSAILSHVTSGDYTQSWATLNLGRVQLQVSADALKIGGVRINASATVQQQIADALGCLLPTPKVFDAMWLARAATLSPVTLPISSTTAAMVQASQKLDAELAALGNPAGIVVQQKTWVLTNVLTTTKAANYGFFVIPNQPGYKWNGIGTDPCASFPMQPQLGRVIQSVGTAHDPSHVDYSQECWLMQRRCTVDGQPADLAAVLQDPALSALVSSEGPLRILRQPGVPVFACPIAASQTPPPPGGLCPLPGVQPLPVTPPAPSGGRGGLAVVGVVIAGGLLAGLYYALRR
jgi:hypothetical protein